MTEREAMERQLQKNLEKLQRNLAQVPLQTLKTTYQKPYEALIAEIRMRINFILSDEALGGVRVAKEDGDPIIQAIKELIEKERKPGGILAAAREAVYKDYSVEGLVKQGAKLKEKIWEIYEPYFEEHIILKFPEECFEEPYPDPKIYNELTGEFYTEGTGWHEDPELEAATEHAMTMDAKAWHFLGAAFREQEKREAQEK